MHINPVIFGSTGMIGQSVLLECIDDERVDSILCVNRHPSDIRQPKVREIIHKDFNDLSALVAEFAKYDTCFFCLGVTSMGLSEEEYENITYDMTIRVAESLLKSGSSFTFCYISGEGSDSSEKGKVMWARVKGKTENKLLSMPFRKAFMFRPGVILPMRGVKSRTRWYRIFYAIARPFYFILKNFKSYVTNSSSLGKAMINAAIKGYPRQIIESRDINILAESNDH